MALFSWIPLLLLAKLSRQYTIWSYQDSPHLYHPQGGSEARDLHLRMYRFKPLVGGILPAVLP